MLGISWTNVLPLELKGGLHATYLGETAVNRTKNYRRLLLVASLEPLSVATEPRIEPLSSATEPRVNGNRKRLDRSNPWIVDGSLIASLEPHFPSSGTAAYDYSPSSTSQHFHVATMERDAKF